MAVLAGRTVPSGRAGGDVASGRNRSDVSQKEDLANFISMITRDETPFMSSIGKTKATGIYHEWQTDTLDAPGDSKISEGVDYIVPGRTAGIGGGDVMDTGDQYAVIGAHRSRLGNYAQINGKTIAVSGTRRAIDQSGVADEYAYQLKKRGTEMRRDLEADMVHTYQPAGAGVLTPDDGTQPLTAIAKRRAGGFQAWINDPTTVAFASSDFTAPTSRGIGSSTVQAGGTATGGALSLSDIDSTMQKIYEAGGKASKIMLSPKLRRDFSDLMVTDSGVRRNIDMDGKLRQSVDVYMSDFGDLMVVPNYIMGLSQTTLAADTGVAFNASNSCALIYDPMWFSIATLRPLQEVDVGQRGDSTIGMMVEECTLEVKNPVGCGAIYGLA